MNTKTIVVIAAVLVVLGAGYALARPANGGFWNGMMGGYGGMMGNYGTGGFGPGYGMMGYGNGMMGNYGGYGPGGMMDGYGGIMNANGGNGLGHCGAGYGYSGTGYGDKTPITIEEAKKSVEQYLASTGNSDLVITEVIEFDNHFYAGVKEKSTGIHAFELLVNKYTGAITPEMGPNMMWNTKYGHMSLYAPAQAAVTKEQALKDAQAYLDRVLPGTEVGDADAFYGYYTMEVTKDGKIYGMLSVNGNTGAVWYHNWHGAFMDILEVE